MSIPDRIRADALKVHLAGSDYLTAAGLVQLLGKSGYIEVSGVSSSGREALEAVRSELPDVVLVDSGVADPGAAETIAAITRLPGPPRVALLAGGLPGERQHLMEMAFRAGARGYLGRDASLEDAAAALRIVHRGGVVSTIFPLGGNSLGQVDAGGSAARRRFSGIGARDLAIVRALADGRTNLEISKSLHVSEATIKARLARVMQQLGVDNRVQLAVAAVTAGLLKPS